MVSRALGVSRSHLYATLVKRRAPRISTDDETVLEALKAVVNKRTSYGYRRAVAILNRARASNGISKVNHKRAYRLMKDAGLLLKRHVGLEKPVHEGKVQTLFSDTRWCSDGFEFRCFNGEKVYVVFSLDTCDREVISFAASTEYSTGETVRELMLASVEARFGKQAVRLPQPIQWLSDNGPQFKSYDTRAFGAELGFDVCNTPAYSPESNGMAEALVKTFKRDYVYVNELPTAQDVIARLQDWFQDYNEYHPHKALKMLSPRQYRRKIAARNASPLPASEDAQNEDCRQPLQLNIN